MHDLTFETEKAGLPRRVMTIVDHTIAITDIAFSNDDTKVYTSSLDGCLYEWRIGHGSRVGEYVYRGIPITRVLVSPISGVVVASVEPAVDVVAANRRRMAKKGSVMPVTPGVAGDSIRRNSTVQGLSRSPSGDLKGLGSSCNLNGTSPIKSPFHPAGLGFRDSRAVTADSSRAAKPFLAVWKSGHIDENAASLLLTFKVI